MDFTRSEWMDTSVFENSSLGNGLASLGVASDGVLTHPYKFDHAHSHNCGCEVVSAQTDFANAEDVVVFNTTDIPADNSTTASITVGGTLTSEIDVAGDRDWIRIELTAGDELTFSLYGSGASALLDPYVRLYNSDGVMVAENDDGGEGYNSLLRYVVSTSGTYYVEAASWNDQFTGQYSLDVYETPPLEVYTLDQIAGQLTEGYWGGNSRSFDITSGQITYNISALPANAQALAVAALDLWSDITGIVFVETTGSGQLRFQDTDDGAYASSSRSGSTINYSTINVDASWVDQYGATLDSYSFQTYVHEIGHALGLGHGGNYNGNASYGTDALYANDSWATTVMSYFDQGESYYFSDLGFSVAALTSPMVADVVAITNLYGFSATTRLGDTTYGFNSTSDRSIHDATQFSDTAYTLVDSGGVDTLDYSGFSADQLINLSPEVFMNIGGLTGNVVIGRGTVIENAIGGSGEDEIYGNAEANELLGGAGADYVIGYGGDDSLEGGSQADDLYGAGGNDTIYGDSGYDRIYGGGGNDVINGGSAGDRVQAGAGNDRVVGGFGNDILLGQTGDDDLKGNDGKDRMYGGDGDDELAGGEGFDRLFGNADDDWLSGGEGDDQLTGGTGNDTFVFDSALGPDNIDEILDFGDGDDTIFLDSSIFSAIATGVLSASAFHAGTSAADADDRILYNSATGEIWYDADGTGGQAKVLFATVTPGTDLTPADFFVG